MIALSVFCLALFTNVAFIYPSAAAPAATKSAHPKISYCVLIGQESPLKEVSLHDALKYRNTKSAELIIKINDKICFRLLPGDALQFKHDASPNTTLVAALEAIKTLLNDPKHNEVSWQLAHIDKKIYALYKQKTLLEHQFNDLTIQRNKLQAEFNKLETELPVDEFQQRIRLAFSSIDDLHVPTDQAATHLQKQQTLCIKIGKNYICALDKVPDLNPPSQERSSEVQKVIDFIANIQTAVASNQAHDAAQAIQAVQQEIEATRKKEAQLVAQQKALQELASGLPPLAKDPKSNSKA